ncbi:MAG TPA: NADH-quinone oxidoreductase subunit L, partial [Planctomycetota bacterium]|nr:NADH-quinone oxidoreductase subunit L [Planctomycetota bacterium]
FEKKENAAAGMKAFIVNRVGDFAFTIGVLYLFVWIGRTYGVWTLDFEGIREVVVKNADTFSVGVATFVGIMLFIGATGKSAQIPLYVWLPDAMAGPTPVSALIHAATMVTAGVYMIARLNFLYALAPAALAVVATVGALTALFAGTIGITQNDIKKVLAYSTVSQLGFMFLGVGVGAFAAGVFHLFTHAFFKACLFLGSGSVIHGMGGEQDIRRMGALKSKMPWTWATFGISTLAIAGIFPFAGFFSKDEILWKTFNTHAFPHGWEWLRFALYGLGVIAALCTAFYMTRLVVKTFHGEAKWSAAGAHSGGGKGREEDDEPMPLPDDASLLDLGAVGKKKNPPPPPKPEEDLAALPDDASLLDLGAVGKKKHAAPPPPPGHEDESLDVAALGDDASLLDLGHAKPHKASAAAHHDPHAHDAHGTSQAHDARGAHAAHDDHGHGGGHGHGHHGEPHECPWSMRLALVVLAICAVFVGFLGLPHVMGPNLFEHWLHPVFADGEAILKKHAGDAAHGSAALEWLLMAFSMAVAIVGILAAVKVYLKGRGAAAEKFAAEHPELYALVNDKYRVDELYDATVVKPTLSLNEAAAVFDHRVIDGAVNGAAGVGKGTSGGVGSFDNEVVDGAVNLAATATQELGRRVRRVQTGNIRDYLTIALVGALFVIAVFCLYIQITRR